MKKSESNYEGNLLSDIHHKLKFSQLIDVIEEFAIFLLNTNGEIQLANKGAYRIFRVKPDQMRGEFSTFCGIDSEGRNMDKLLLHEALVRGSAEHYGWRCITGDGKFWAHTVITPLFEHETHTGFSVVMRNLTERRLAEAKYRGLLDTAPDAIVILDEKGQITIVNHQTEVLFGYNRSELLGKTIETLLPEDHRKLFLKNVPAHISAAEMYARSKSGQLIPVEVSSSPTESESGTMITCMIRDITSRVKINAELTEAHAGITELHTWLQGIIDGSGDLIAALDNSFKLVAFNKKFQDFYQEHLGLKVSQGANMRELMQRLPREFSNLLDRWEEALEGKAFEFEHVVTLSGKRHILHFSFNSVLDASGKLMGAAHIVRDITIEKENANLILTNEARLREAQQYAKMGSFELDIESGQYYWSEAMFDILGVPRDYPISWKALEELVISGHRENLNNALNYSLLTLEPFRHEYQVKRPADGNLVDIYGFANIIIEEGGKKKLIGIVQDITERKAIENELNAALSKSQEAAKLKQEFLANMSHEIRTPMNVIIGFTKLLLQSKELTGENLDYAKTIYESSEDLLVIINDVLDFSKMEAGKLSLESCHFDLRSKLNSLHKLFNIKVEDKDVRLLFETDPDMPDIVVGDPVRITQLLTNLLSNAVKFTEHGFVKLCTTVLEKSKTSCRIQFEVIDTGIGFSADKQELIFQSFQQAEGDISRRFGGTGLGLAIVRNILNLMDGDIKVESEEGKGSRFIIALDLLIGDKMHLQIEDPFAAETGFKKLNYRVLLAEDNRNNQVLAKKVLQEFGCTTDIANNGKEAVELHQANVYDIILMDIQMPEMDGLQAVKIIRGMSSDKSEIPIVAFTAHALREEREKYLASGMNAHINKPYSPAELYQTLVALVSEKDANFEMDVIPQASLNTFMEMLDNDEDLVQEMLSIFCQDVPNYLKVMEEARTASNWPMIAQVAHTLKSSLSFTGRTDLVEIAEKLQHQKQKPIGKKVPNMLDHFIQQTTALCSDYQKMLDEKQGQSS